MKHDSDNNNSASDDLRKAFVQFSHDMANRVFVLGCLKDRLLNPNLSGAERDQVIQSFTDTSRGTSLMMAHFYETATTCEPIHSRKSTLIAPISLARTASQLASLAPTGHKVVLEIAEPLPAVRGDENKLLRVLENLVSNAVKYSPTGTTIRIRIESDEDNRIIWSVADEGEGIPEEWRGCIFDDNVRMPHHYEHEGKGVGLAFCRETVESHSGQIWMEPNTPKGSVFYVSIPT